MSVSFNRSLLHLQQLTEFDMIQDELYELLTEGDTKNYQRIMNRLHLSGVLDYVTDPHFIRMYAYMKGACEHPSDFEQMIKTNEENHLQICIELSENVMSSVKKDKQLLYVIQALLGSYEVQEDEE